MAPVVCPENLRALGPNEFELALDSEAFQFYLLSTIRALRVTKLDVSGRWTLESDRIFTRDAPFTDDFLTIEPAPDAGTNGKDAATISIAVKESKGHEVFFMYHGGRRPEAILCHKGHSPLIYINLRLKKQKLAPGRSYEVADDAFLLCSRRLSDGSREAHLLLVNTPDAPTDKRADLTELADHSFDPSLLFIASRSLHNPVA